MKIVVVDGAALVGDELNWDDLQSFGDLVIHERLTDQSAIDACSDADIAITNKVPFDRETLGHLPDLKMIAVTATGYNVIDIAACQEKGVVVSNVPAYSSEAVAQHVFAVLLAVIHQPETHSSTVHDGRWIASPDFSFWLRPTWELAGKQLGIYGFGQIGSAVGKIASAFGMNVVVSSRSKKDPSDFDFDFRYVERDELFSTSDVISLHCPETEQTRGLVDAQLLKKMKPSGILINTARGGLVVESDLANALNEGQIQYACLDVVSVEPMSPENPLLGVRNCLITPHNAWATLEARQRCLEITIANVASFLEGNPQNVVS